MTDRRLVAELRWVFRPAASRPPNVRALAGQPVHGTGLTGSDGKADVTLADGTHVRAAPAEIIAE